MCQVNHTLWTEHLRKEIEEKKANEIDEQAHADIMRLLEIYNYPKRTEANVSTEG
jgi:hypothetical protein